MAQMCERDFDGREKDEKERRRTGSGSFKFNVAAAEFVPTHTMAAAAPAQLPITGYFYPCFQSIDGASGSWIYVSDQEITLPLVHTKHNPNVASTHPHPHPHQPKDVALSDELKHKIIKQVFLNCSIYQSQKQKYDCGICYRQNTCSVT